jgi:hypothetical protein
MHANILRNAIAGFEMGCVALGVQLHGDSSSENYRPK